MNRWDGSCMRAPIIAPVVFIISLQLIAIAQLSNIYGGLYNLKSYFFTISPHFGLMWIYFFFFDLVIIHGCGQVEHLTVPTLLG